MASSHRVLGNDPTLFIVLAAENGAAAQREADAWSVVANFARAIAHRDSGDAAHAAAFAGRAREDLHKLMTNPLYAGIPPLAETSKHVHGWITMLADAL
jgi:hypothetical protein